MTTEKLTYGRDATIMRGVWKTALSRGSTEQASGRSKDPAVPGFPGSAGLAESCSSNKGSDALVLLGPPSLRHEALEQPQGRALRVNLRLEPTLPNTVVLSRDEHVALQAHCDGGSKAPLFLLLRSGSDWLPYTQTTITATDMVFIALDLRALHGDPAEPGTVTRWLTTLGELHRLRGPQLNNHQRWFVNACEGVEIEQKFSLDGSPDVWSLATATLNRVTAGELSEWIPEHGNNDGFEQWDFVNYLFAIDEPASQRGDIAFIPAVNGRWILRRKWFTTDAAVRREELVEGIRLPADPDLPKVITERLGLVPAWEGAYRRIRYNVMLESLRTGHVFSIMFDRSLDLSARTPPLHQVEVEYIRTRSTLDRSRHLVEDFHTLTDWTRQFLAGQGVAATEHHLSKLSWLRAANSDHPP